MCVGVSSDITKASDEIEIRVLGNKVNETKIECIDVCPITDRLGDNEELVKLQEELY